MYPTKLYLLSLIGSNKYMVQISVSILFLTICIWSRFRLKYIMIGYMMAYYPSVSARFHPLHLFYNKYSVMSSKLPLKWSYSISYDILHVSHLYPSFSIFSKRFSFMSHYSLTEFSITYIRYMFCSNLGMYVFVTFSNILYIF